MFLLSGSFFSEAEAKGGDKVAVIAENMAKAIWGSASAAIGKDFGATTRNSWESPGPYRIVGVFKEPSTMAHRFLNVPSLFIPYSFSGYPGRGMMVMNLRVQSDNPNMKNLGITPQIQLDVCHADVMAIIENSFRRSDLREYARAALSLGPALDRILNFDSGTQDANGPDELVWEFIKDTMSELAREINFANR